METIDKPVKVRNLTLTEVNSYLFSQNKFESVQELKKDGKLWTTAAKLNGDQTVMHFSKYRGKITLTYGDHSQLLSSIDELKKFISKMKK